MHNKINNQYVNNVQYCCRVPQGTCGLKLSVGADQYFECVSGPARDLWIEIKDGIHWKSYKLSSGPARDLWIEIAILWMRQALCTSGPARDLWIEIPVPLITQY